MLDMLPPGATPETDVVTCKVFIENTVLSSELELNQLTINKTFNKIAFAKLVFADGSASDRDFELSNNDMFSPGKQIKIQLGYHGNVATVFEGIIIKHGIKARQNGHSLLQIEAKDKAVLLTASPRSACYIDKSDADVISELAAGLQPDVNDASVVHKQIVQYNATDWDFIVMRAEVNGLLVFTDDNKLIVNKPATNSTPVATATYGQNMQEFEAEMDARRQKLDYKATSWNFTSQQAEESDAGTASFTENGNISSDDLASVLNSHVTLNQSAYITQDQLQKFADAHALRNQLSKSTGRVRLNGNADIKPGTLLTLEGVGDRFNGDVLVTGIQHHYNGSWYSDVQFGWQEEWFCKKDDIGETPAAGMVPAINGLQIGIVKDLDDNIDGGQYRLKVQIPGISGGDGIWARVATLDAGNNRGVYFRPEVDDEVVLGFLNDNPAQAVILGCLHSKDSKQSPLPEQNGSLQSGFVTKEGIKLVFDDTNKRMTMLVPGASGEKSIIINNASGALEIKDENQNIFKMDQQGITIQSSGIVTIKGSQILVNS